jgi:GDP-L-fucose synthase
MRILITGGAGFVGRRFTRYFLQKGYEVVVVDSIVEKTGGLDPKKGWKIFKPFDYKNFIFHNMDCRKWFLENKNEYFDYAFHLAAIVGGREMIEKKPLAVAEDLSIDSQFWNWSVISKPGKVVCFSSSACYPINLQRPGSYRLLKETDINFKKNIGIPDMSYGWSKLTCEYLANLAFKNYNIKSVCYRPFSGYGEDQDLNYPFPNLCRKIFQIKKNYTIKVWGSGKQMRDFIYIDDCVDGVIKTMDKIHDGSALNLSTGILTSFYELIFQGSELLDKKIKISPQTSKPEGVFARGGDIKKQIKYGFSYKTNLKQGLKKSLEYLCNN